MNKENKRTNNDLQSNPQKIELHAPHKIPGDEIAEILLKVAFNTINEIK
jgi:hypothetical protein